MKSQKMTIFQQHSSAILVVIALLASPALGFSLDGAVAAAPVVAPSGEDGLPSSPSLSHQLRSSHQADPVAVPSKMKHEERSQVAGGLGPRMTSDRYGDNPYSDRLFKGAFRRKRWVSTELQLPKQPAAVKRSGSKSYSSPGASGYLASKRAAGSVLPDIFDSWAASEISIPSKRERVWPAAFSQLWAAPEGRRPSGEHQDPWFRSVLKRSMDQIGDGWTSSELKIPTQSKRSEAAATSTLTLSRGHQKDAQSLNPARGYPQEVKRYKDLDMDTWVASELQLPTKSRRSAGKRSKRSPWDPSDIQVIGERYLDREPRSFDFHVLSKRHGDSFTGEMMRWVAPEIQLPDPDLELPQKRSHMQTYYPIPRSNTISDQLFRALSRMRENDSDALGKTSLDVAHSDNPDGCYSSGSGLGSDWLTYLLQNTNSDSNDRKAFVPGHPDGIPMEAPWRWDLP